MHAALSFFNIGSDVKKRSVTGLDPRHNLVKPKSSLDTNLKFGKSMGLIS